MRVTKYFKEVKFSVKFPRIGKLLTLAFVLLLLGSLGFVTTSSPADAVERIDGLTIANGEAPSIGTFAKWSKVEIQLLGPASQGMDNLANPFQVPVDVTFTGPGGTFVVPAFYDGDGKGGLNGNVWKVRFSPNAAGTWTYTSQSSNSLLNGRTDAFEVTEPTACAAYAPGGLPEFRCVGRLESVGEHYLKFADGPYWIKGGTDEPEDFLAPGRNVGFSSKEAAIDYLAGKGVNSVYLMTHNIGGDGKNVWPWVGSDPSQAQSNNHHFDVAKLAQWEQWFNYMQSQGLVIHLVLEDDSGWTGFNRNMYYREIIARFGHYNGLYWNISEEYNENYSGTQVKSFAQMIQDLDAYNHPITVHNQGGLSNLETFLGDSRFGLTSFQKNAPLNGAAAEWFQKVEDSGWTIPIAFDETAALSPDDRNLTRRIVWSTYVGGANFETFIRPLSTYTDFGRHFEDMTRARGVIESLPFWQMRPSNSLLTSGTGFVFAQAGEAYAVYLPNGGNINLDLSSNTNSYTAQWFNTRDGTTQDTGTVDGGGVRLFSAPDSNDWALLLRRSGIGSNVAPTVSSQAAVTLVNTPLDLTLSYTDPDGPGPYTFTIDGSPSHGALSGSGANRRYTPAANYTGPDSFQWHLNDSLTNSAAVTFNLTVKAPGENLPPVAEDQDVSMGKDSSIDIQLVYTDPDGPGPYTVAILQQPVNGTVTGTDNDRTYTPNSGFLGVDTFTWKVNDGPTDSAQAIVNITVNNPRDAIFIMSLQGRQDEDNGPPWTMPFEVKLLTPAGGGPYTRATSFIASASSSTSKNGTFLLNVVPGTYDIWAKGENTLAALLTNVDLTVEPLARVQLGLLKGGDLTRDNIVNDQDYTPLLAVFGRPTSSLPPKDQLNDHNQDGIVDIIDYSIVVEHFGQSGPAKP